MNDSDMTFEKEDTVAALATAVGGGVAVIRISGPDALKIGNTVWKSTKTLCSETVRRMMLGRILDPETNSTGDQAMAVFMQGPQSYTGEDVVELQCHGGNFTAKHTLMCCLKAGARHAEPGEFTKRAYINGRMDLTQAEAVNDLINAQSEMAMNLAMRQLDGRLGNSVKDLYVKLTELHSEIEVRMDFVDEELDWTPDQEVVDILESSNRDIEKMLKQQQDGEVLRQGIKAIIGGPPNAGKSSFLNQVLGHDRAIVTDIAGTTRDTLEEQAQIRGIPIRLVDTAGIRESDDIVEKTGIQRSLQVLKEAQLVFWLMDLTRPLEEQLPPQNYEGIPIILVFNKIDLVDSKPELPEELAKLSNHHVYTSFMKGDGVEDLYDKVEEVIWKESNHEAPEFALNARHAALLIEASRQLKECLEIIKNEQWELVAINMKGALYELGQVLGETVLPDILDNIFHKYCIGK
ncbi:MAG: tRNA uridine-5-carboxymethylaminomethyl(34) synthesis GTPase MnmE [Lentisphaeraceae bacterium]|nr:tRNA uridine-5-carboxymethylaminomethyl(34) synthesis GTPase MnmE [Lentisphaeraceae bacterium]